MRHIRGELILDTRHFEIPPHDPGAFDGEPFAPYNAAPGALVANFNAIVLRIKPTDEEVLIVPDIALPGVALVVGGTPDGMRLGLAVGHRVEARRASRGVIGHVGRQRAAEGRRRAAKPE